MVNEISGPRNLVSGVTSQQQSEQTKNAESAKGSGAQSTAEDSVSLTDQAAKLSALEASIEKQPVVDTKRVEAIRSAILDGSYNVNAEQTAEKLMAFETLLDQSIGDE